VEIRSWRPGEW